MTPLIWIGIAFCISQSAMFSGLNLAVFSVSKLRLEVEASSGNQDARRVLALRRHSNFLLPTILWGDVCVNVLLAQLANSVLAGVVAFLFSAVLITFAGEILPQAYFSRNALRVAALLAPVLRTYQIILYPVARPTAYMLDKLLGAEKTDYLTEHSLRELITIHAWASEVDVDRVEGAGALNFPAIERSCDDPFLEKLDRSGKKWVVITDRAEVPRVVLDADGFLRDALLGEESFNPHRYCHRPIVVTEDGAGLGDTIPA